MPEAAPVSAAEPPAPPAGAKGEVTVVEPTRSEQTVVRRIAESRAVVPDVTVSADADLTAVAPLLDGPGLVALVVRAAALALREHPRANGSYRDARFELFSRVNVGVALAVPDGLAVPTLFDADRRDAEDLAAGLAALAERARAGELTSPETSNATFTVWDAGGAGSLTPVVVPPQAAALAAGAVVARPVVRDRAVVAAPVTTLTLAADHRILHPAAAADFLAAVRERLERGALAA